MDLNFILVLRARLCALIIALYYRILSHHIFLGKSFLLITFIQITLREFEIRNFSLTEPIHELVPDIEYINFFTIMF